MKQQEFSAKKQANKENYQLSKNKNDNCFEISAYRGGFITAPGIAKAAKLLKTAYPNKDKDFWELFFNRVHKNKFTDKRLIDSIYNVIDNCPYPNPSISSFISFDKKIKVYTYNQILKMHDIDRDVFSKYKRININGNNKMFAHINDIKKYEL